MIPYHAKPIDFPEVVCLCGSTRFYETFAQAKFDLTIAGKIVLSIGCDTKRDAGLALTAEQKVMLDELHKRKIDMADSILVLNVGGYIGESTQSEINYAEAHGIPVAYLEPHSLLIEDPGLSVPIRGEVS